MFLFITVNSLSMLLAKPHLGQCSFNVDIYIRLAKDFLYDDDASVKYSEKLAKYYDEIVS